MVMYYIYYPIIRALKTNVRITFRIWKKLEKPIVIGKYLEVKILIGKTHSQFKNIWIILFL